MKSTIHVWDLPQEGTYITLNDQLRKKLVGTILNIEPKKRKLDRQFDEKDHGFDSFIEGRAKSLKFLLNIYTFLKINKAKISLKEIEKNIKSIKAGKSRGINSTIIRPKLPVNFATSDGARILAAIYGDGCISKSLRGSYCNMNIHLRKKVYLSLQKVFGEVRTINNYKEFKIPKICSLFIVQAINYPIGNKTKTNPKFPNFIIDNRNLARYALQQIVDDEGCISYNKKKKDRNINISQSINVTQLNKKQRQEVINKNDTKYAPNLLIDAQKMLDSFKIESRLKCVNETITKKKEIRHKWILVISGRENLEKFAFYINFLIKKKKESLNKAIKSYQRKQYRIGRCMEIALKAVKRLSDQNIPITAKTLARKLKRTEGYAKELLNKLYSNRRINIKRNVIYKPYATYPAIYGVGDKIGK